MEFDAFVFGVVDFPIVARCGVNDVAHFKQARVNPPLGKVFDLVDVLVGCDDGQAPVGVARVDQIVKHFEFPLCISLHAEIIDDQEWYIAQVGQNLIRILEYSTSFSEVLRVSTSYRGGQDR